MTTRTLPAEIAVESLLPDGVCFRLPCRPLWTGKALAWVAIVVGLGIVLGASVWIGVRLSILPDNPIGMVLSSVFALPEVFLGVGVASLGLAALFGHSELEVDSKGVHGIERLGPCRWRRTVALGDVTRFVVMNQVAGDADGGDAKPAMLTTISLEPRAGKTRWLAPAYPHDWLVPLAENLAAQCQRLRGTTRLDEREAEDEDRTPIKVSEVILGQTSSSQQVDRAEKPPGSPIVHEAYPDGLSLNVPPAGLQRGSRGLFGFSLLWNGFMLLFTAFVGVASFKEHPGKELLPFAAFMALFWAIGIGLFLGALNMGRRRAAIAVVGDRLMVLQTGLFRSKSREWARGDLKTVCVGSSGMAVNDMPILELQIVPASGSKFGMLAGRDDAELQWIATLLRQALEPDRGGSLANTSA